MVGRKFCPSPKGGGFLHSEDKNNSVLESQLPDGKEINKAVN